MLPPPPDEPELNFDGPPPDDRTPGERGRDEGMERAITHAEKCRPGWKDDAIAMIARFPLEEFRAEQLSAFAYANGLDRPPAERAWGSVMVQARRAGLVAPLGFEKTVGTRIAHTTFVCRWRKT